MGQRLPKPRPTVSAAVTDGTYTAVTWSLQATANNNAEANQEIRLDFYANGQAQTWLGSITVETSEQRLGLTAAFTNFTYVPLGNTITATATSLGTGDTSELASPVTVTSASGAITVSPAETTTSLSVSSTVVLTRPAVDIDGHGDPPPRARPTAR